MLLLEEIGVEAVMIFATLTAAAIFFWATGTMLVRWVRYTRSEAASVDSPSTSSVRAVKQSQLTHTTV